MALTTTYGSKYDAESYYDWFPDSAVIDSTHIMTFGHDDNFSKGTAKIATISGTTITWGPSAIYNNATVYSTYGVMLDSTTVCIVYRDGNNYCWSIIGTISGTTITFGTRIRIGTGSCKETVSVVRLDSSTVFASWNDGSKANNAIGTVSGTTITWGTLSVFNPYESEELVSLLIDTNTVLMCCYSRGDFTGKAVIATISGSTISYGSIYQFNNAVAKSISLNLIDSTRILISFNDYYLSQYNLVSVVATRSGTALTFGGKKIIYASGYPSTYIKSTVIDSQYSFNVYDDNNNSAYGTSVVGTIDGTDITYDTPVVFNTANTDWPRTNTIDSTKAFVFWRNPTDSTTYGIIADFGGGTPPPPSGWSHKINGFEPASVNSIDITNIEKINGV